MIMLFYVIVLFLLGAALIFVLPGLKRNSVKCGMSVFFVVAVLGIYQFVGRSEALSEYYSEPYRLAREKKYEIRPMMTALRKEEHKLRVGLERRPQDLEARLRWLEVLAILALESQDPDQAQACWQEALRLIPPDQQHREQRMRIKELLAQVQG